MARTDAETAYARDWGMNVAVNDIHAVIQAARKGGRKVTLGGHSLGGSIIDAYAAWDFHAALYENQPTEGSDGLSDGDIADIARAAGVPGDVVDAFGDGTFEPWVASVTNAAFDAGLQGTPTITIDGQPFQGDPYSTGPLTDAIETAASGK